MGGISNPVTGVVTYGESSENKINGSRTKPRKNVSLRSWVEEDKSAKDTKQKLFT